MVVIRNEPARPSPRRVTAWSGAFALHVVVLGVLLAPIARGPAEQPLPREVDPALALVEIARAVASPPVPPSLELDRARPRPRPVILPARVEIARPERATSAMAEPSVVTAAPPIPASPGDARPVAHAGAAVRLSTLAAPPPHYPSIGLRRRLEGIVLLRVAVTDDGRPRDVAIERSSGHRVLDEAARRQVLQRWRFVPAMRDGVAVPAVGLVPIAFRLEAG